MQCSSFCINPSYFEGWSSSVEQANAYKKIIILSKIKVHLEQKPKYCNYFDPKNSKNLSKMILNVYKNKKHYKQKFKFILTEKKLNQKIFNYSKNFCKKIK